MITTTHPGYQRILERILVVFGAAALLFLAWSYAKAVTGTGVSFDDAFIANVAKNLALGNGYSSSYYGIRPFDVEITTGPTLILPAAALVRWFGNRHWVPNLAFALCVWTLLAVLLVQLRRRLNHHQLAACAGLLAIGLVSLSTRDFGLLGEVPAGLLIGISALAITRDNNGVRSAAIAGLAAGAAVISKAIAALALPALIAWLLFAYGDRPGRWRLLVSFLAFLALPFCVFEVWKMVALPGGMAEWVRLTRTLATELFGSNAPLSGAGTLRKAFGQPSLILNTASRNLGNLSVWWGDWRHCATALAVTAVLSWSTRTDRGDSQSRSLAWASYALFAAAFIHFVWWLGLSVGWPRYLLPGVLYWLMGTALLVALTARHNTKWAATALVLLTLSFGPPDLHARFSPAARQIPHGAFAAGTPVQLDDPAKWHTKKWGPWSTYRLRALLEATNYLRSAKQDPRVVLVGCAWVDNSDLEYMLSGTGHFRHCLSLTPRDTVGKRLVLARNELFNLEHSPRLERFRESCERRVLFRSYPFVISECAALPSDEAGYAAMSEVLPDELQGVPLVAGATCNLEDVNRRPLGAEPLEVKRSDRLTFSGWIIDQHGRTSFERVWVRAVGGSRQLYARAIDSAVKRVDVATYFENSAYERAGFRVLVDPQAQSPGEYSMAVIGFSAGRAHVCETSKKILLR